MINSGICECFGFFFKLYLIIYLAVFSLAFWNLSVNMVGVANFNAIGLRDLDIAWI